MKILFLGDIVSSSGRNIVNRYLKDIKIKYDIDFVIANGENSAHGKGMTRKIYEELMDIVKPLYSEFNLDEKLSAKEVLEEIIKLRKQSRDNKDWAESDRIRDLLLANKIQLKDSKEGTTWAIL